MARTQDLRASNRAAVLRMLRAVGPLPRAALARQTGLSATTMTKVVGQLVDEGFVVEGAVPEVEARVGRPSIAVSIARNAAAVVGVQLGVGTVRIGLCDLTAEVGKATEFTFDPKNSTGIAVVDRVASNIEALIKKAGVARERLLGVGVAAPGPVDAANRDLLLSINLGWRQVPIADRLEAKLGLPVVVDHNVRAMAVAEALYGASRGAQNLLFVYGRTGTGAGLVLDGRPFRAGSHGVLELGHVKVVDDGEACACGSNGCLETVLGDRYLRARVRRLRGGRAAQADPLGWLTTRAEAGSAAAEESLDYLVAHLATALGSAVNLLNPEVIVLGGAFETAGEPFLDRLGPALRDRTFPVLRDTLTLRLSSLGPDAGITGGASVALERFLYAD